MMDNVKSDRRRTRQRPPAVLIVEDDGFVADATAEAIEALGYRAIRAGDGLEALEALKQEQPAMLLVDMSLPGMSGSEFLRFVRNHPIWSRIPRVIMTATNDPMIRLREDVPVFYKPLDMASLAAIVHRYCERARPPVSALAERRG